MFSATDPCALRPSPTFPDVRPYFAAGRTRVDPRLRAERTAVLVGIGQSNIAGSIGAIYTPSSPRVENLNFVDGGVYLAQEPLLGDHNLGNPVPLCGNILTRIADAAIHADLFDRVIVAPMAVSSTKISQWGPADFGRRIPAMASRLRAHGYVTPFILWDQGESDNGITSRVSYRNSLLAIIDAWEAEGLGGRFFVALATYRPDTAPKTDPQIRLAQQDCVAARPGRVFQGADTDSLDASARDASAIHFSPTIGSPLVAQLWVNVLRDYYASL